MRKVTAQEKKAKGTFNVTRDKDSDFKILDGLLQLNPEPPEGYSPEMVEMWNRAWRHLIKHQYGKEIDFEIVNALVFEWHQYLKYRQFDHTAKLAKDSLSNYLSASNALCLNPNALGRAALLQKQPKQNSFKDAVKAKSGT
jgi:phage terminase small subunit